MDAPKDKFERVAATASFALVIMANESTGDWELIDLEPVGPERERAYKARGLCVGGIIGVMADGKPATALDMPFDDATVTDITREFLARLAYAVKHPRWICAPVMHAN